MQDKKWNDFMLVQCYQFAQAGMKDMKIAQSLGVTYKTFKTWLKKKNALRQCLREARTKIKAQSNFRDYVYNKLDTNIKELWDQIESPETNTMEEIEAILMDQGEKVRQRLFVHALVTYSFNPSDAMAKVNITTKELKRWIATDVEFAELMDEIQFHKKNYIEGGLYRLIEAGHPGAIMYANERLNDDRGYGKKVKVNHEGQVLHSHTMSVDDLDLTLEDKKKILQAIRHRQEAVVGAIEDVVDAEYTELEK